MTDDELVQMAERALADAEAAYRVDPSESNQRRVMSAWSFAQRARRGAAAERTTPDGRAPKDVAKAELQVAPDAVLVLIDAVLVDLAVRSGMYVGRRREDGDNTTFVIQTGEEGRARLRLPQLSSDASVERMILDAQTHLGHTLGAPVPLCPRHAHALVAACNNGQITWRCPSGEWACALGEYEERTWPQTDVASLAPILSRRLARRGTFRAVRSISVVRSGERLVADFGIAGRLDDELLSPLEHVAAPLPVITHASPWDMIRPLQLPE